MKRTLIPVMLLLGAAPAFAQPAPAAGGQARQEMADARLDSFGARLGLDDAELGRFRATIERYRGRMQPLRADLGQTRHALRDELAKAPPDDSRLAQLEDRLSSDRQQLEALHTARMAELKRELTPQQYAKLLLRPHLGRRAHSRGRGPQ